MFEFLFKYRPIVFEQGHLVLSSPRVIAIGLVVALLVAAPTIATYRRVSAKSSLRDRIVLGALRGAALLVLLVCLLRPMMVLQAAVTRRNVLAVVIDDSRSMQVADRDDKPRSAFIAEALAPNADLVKALSEKFILRFFKFSSGADRIESVAQATFGAPDTHIGSALEHVHDDLAGTPVSGIVMLTDGADNSRVVQGAPTLDDQLRALKARAVPVYTVGLGRETFSKDIQVSRIEAPRSVLKGASLVVNVIVSQHGYGGQKVPLIVEDSGRVVVQQDVELPPDGETAPVRVHVPAATAGARVLTFKIPVRPDEMVRQNNSQSAVVNVLGRREKILYVEGEPRFEMKFVRRAVAEDPNLQVVALLRTAENKYLRMGVDDSLDLVTGFPKSREELFKYRGIILGSVPASFFTLDQIRMLADFVSERGGGLLMLGGRKSFAEGGYGGTPLADVIPLALEARSTSATEDSSFTELKVELTPAGARYAATQVAGEETRSAERYKTLPPLTSVNRVGKPKAGAIVLLNGVPTKGGDKRPVLVWQRYGRGKAIAFPVQDSWLWQMHADVPAEDMTHETLWRQMLRWLVSDVPGQVDILTAGEHVVPKEPVTLRAEVRDAIHVKMNDAQVVAHIVTPSGARRDVPMEWTVERDGEYRGSFTPDERGVYSIAVGATAAGKPVAADTAYVRSDESTAEYFDAEMRASLLRRIARETGGKFYTPETIKSLAKDVVYTKSGATELQQMDLWDMPVVFLLLVALMGGEWVYRRARGLA